MWEHHPALLAFAPPQPQQLQQLRREHGVAILAPLALLNADQHARAVDVVDLEMSDLGHTKTSAISGAERGLVLDAWCCFEQPRRFLLAPALAEAAAVVAIFSLRSPRASFWIRPASRPPRHDLPLPWRAATRAIWPSLLHEPWLPTDIQPSRYCAPLSFSAPLLSDVELSPENFPYHYPPFEIIFASRKIRFHSLSNRDSRP
ncbi:hypothetical protein C8K44_1031 [Aminobacter sp. AP02]|nr:hypothetical protein C8K44_1031 [Aminobacter sp. AP02]